MKASANTSFVKLVTHIKRGFFLLVLLLLFLSLLLSLRLWEQNRSLRTGVRESEARDCILSVSLAASGIRQSTDAQDAGLMRQTQDAILRQIEARRQEEFSLEAVYSLTGGPYGESRQLFVCKNELSPGFSLYAVDYASGEEPFLLADLYRAGGEELAVSILDLDENGEQDILLLYGDRREERLAIQLWLQADGRYIPVNRNRIGGLTGAGASLKLGLLSTEQPYPVPEYATDDECREALSLLAQIDGLEKAYAQSPDYGSAADKLEDRLKEMLFWDGHRNAADLFPEPPHGGLPYTEWREAADIRANLRLHDEYKGREISYVHASIPQSRYSEGIINQWFLDYAEAKLQVIDAYYLAAGTPSGGDDEAIYPYTHSLDIMRNDDAVLSFLEIDRYSCGGPEPIMDQKGFTFDLRTGETLTLRRVMADYDGFVRCAQDCLSVYGDQAENSGIYLVSLLLAGQDCPFYMTGFGVVLLSGYNGGGGYEAYLLPYERIAAYMQPEYLPVSAEASASLGQAGLYVDVTEDGKPDFVTYEPGGPDAPGSITVNGVTSPLPLPEEALPLADNAALRLERDAQGAVRLAWYLEDGFFLTVPPAYDLSDGTPQYIREN